MFVLSAITMCRYRIQVLGSGAKLVPLYFYFLHSSELDIYLVEKVKNHKTIELKRSMELSMNSRHNTTINHKSNTTCSRVVREVKFGL
jgi:hypothetical protein